MQSQAVERGHVALQQVPPPGDWQRTRIPFLSGGMRTDVAPNDLPDNAAVDITNLQTFAGQLQVDCGYGPFGSTYAGTAQIAYQNFPNSGSSDLLLVTTSTVYRYASGTPNQWQLVPWYNGVYWVQASMTTGNTMTLDRVTGLVVGQAVSYVTYFGITINTTITAIGSNTITVAAAPNYTGNDFLNAGNTVQAQAPVWSVATAAGVGASTFYLNTVQGITLNQQLGIVQSNGSQIIGTVTAINTVAVAINLSVASTATVSVGASVAPAVALNGSLMMQVQAQSFPPSDIVVFTNGEDPVFYWNGSVLQTAPGLPPASTCTALAMFHESLFLLGMVENGMEFPQRVRMSDAGNPFEFTPGVGIAAIYNLEDTEDFILQAAILGPWLIVYRETTIMRASYLGLPNNTLYWEYMIYGEGAASQGAVSDIGSQHFFVGNQGLYTYDGGYALTNIGDAVWDGFISAAQGDLDPALKATLFTQYVGEYDECWVVYAPKGSSMPNKLLRVHFGDQQTDAWFKRLLVDQMVSAQPYIPLATTTWATAIGTWAQQNRAWASRVFEANVANILMCTTTQSLVQIYDYQTTTDNGVVIPWTLTSKELFTGDIAVRTERFAFFGVGQANIAVSLDNGLNWTSIGSVNMAASYGRAVYRSLTFQCVTPYLMLQISGTDPDFVLRWAEVWWETETEWWGEGISTWVG